VYVLLFIYLFFCALTFGSLFHCNIDHKWVNQWHSRQLNYLTMC